MISSGKKRGLAAVAVSALAVAGLPFLASSASAAAEDDPTALQLAYVGPSRDAGTKGGVIVLKSKGIDNTANFDSIKLMATDLVNQADNANQTVKIVGTPTFSSDTDTSATTGNKFGVGDGWDEINVRVSVDTATTGGNFDFALVWDNSAFVTGTPSASDDGADKDGDGSFTVTSSDARALVTGSTAGDPTSASVTPTTQTVPASATPNAYYNVTLKDSAGRDTQLSGSETIATTSGATVAGPVDAGAYYVFAANSSTAGLYPIAFNGPGTADTNAQLDVVEAASGLTGANVDIVTGKDTWDGVGNTDGTVPGLTAATVRADQVAVKFDIVDKTKPGQLVTLTAKGTGLTFGGSKTEQTVTTTLNSQGMGSVTFTPDASSIQSGDKFVVGGTGESIGAGAAITVTYAESALAVAKNDAKKYITAFKGTANVGVTLLDQFGDPVPGLWVSVKRTGPNTDTTESVRKQSNAAGHVDFDLTDAKATEANNVDNLTYAIYPSQAAPASAASSVVPAASSITYTTDGLGADFGFTVDSKVPGGSAYDPNTVYANPLTDAKADDNASGDSTNESVKLVTSGGTTDAKVEVTVDNGALLVENLGDSLADGKSTVEGTIGDTFYIVGTKTGLVNVTVKSGGREHTGQVSVKSLTQEAAAGSGDFSAAKLTARNITVSGPASAAADETVTFTAVVTDAFGNPVGGVDASDITATVFGPAKLKSNSAASDENGQISYQVQLDNNAASSVTLQVKAKSGVAQFGAAADHLKAGDGTTATAEGLTASSDSASASITDVVDIAKLQAAVDAAQTKVDNAQDALDVAKGDKKVAKTEKKVAKKEVKAAKKALKKAKKHHKGVKAAKKNLRQAKGANQVAAAKVQVAKKKVKVAKQRLADAQAELEAAQQALEDAQSDDSNNG